MDGARRGVRPKLEIRPVTIKQPALMVVRLMNRVLRVLFVILLMFLKVLRLLNVAICVRRVLLSPFLARCAGVRILVLVGLLLNI